MRSMSCYIFKVVVSAAELKGVVPCISGKVNVDISAVFSPTHQGTSEVTP